MKKYTVAVLGATGIVGREMLRVMQERNFPVGELIPLASSRSAGTVVSFGGRIIPVKDAQEADFTGVDIVLGAAENEVSKALATAIVEAGAVFIDNSSAFRLDPTVPLVVPQINPADVKKHKGIIANPNCTTTIVLTALAPLRNLAPVRSIWAATYQAVSGAGAGGLRELVEQVQLLGQGKPVQSTAFPHQIAYNLIPQIGQNQLLGYTTEEMKLQFEGRKILHDPDLQVSCTCVRVPVMRSHSIALSVGFDRVVQVEDARKILAQAPGCILMDDLPAGEYPMPLLASDQDMVMVGRLRPDLTDECRLSLFCCADQLRKGAATNAVEIAQLLISD